MTGRLAAAAAAILALTLSACGDSGSAPSTAAGGSDAVAWAEKVCKSVEPDVAMLSRGPDVDPSNPQQAKTSLLAYLGDFSTALDHMIGGIRDAGAPPVADGAQAVDRVTRAMEEAKKGVDDARTTLEQANVDDPTSYQVAFTKVAEDMSKLSQLEDPTKDLKSNQELNNAFEQAPTCQKLDGTATSSPPTS